MVMGYTTAAPDTSPSVHWTCLPGTISSAASTWGGIATSVDACCLRTLRR